MKLGITGAHGLLGFHARCCLHSIRDLHSVRTATRATFSSEAALDEFVDGLDGVLHFAGMNRGNDSEVEGINVSIAEKLIGALNRTGARPAIAYANSTHYTSNTAYGRGKRTAGEFLSRWGEETCTRVGNFVLPHVFGEFGKPFHNSVVSTFCHQMAHADAPHITKDGHLELLHAQDVAQRLIAWVFDPSAIGGLRRLNGEPMRVSTMLERLKALLVRYHDDGVVPDLSAPLDLRLFNTLRSYFYPALYPRALSVRKDARGELFEAVKSDQGGQTFLSTTAPGITRGNHWHLQKIERFLVVGGSGVIRIRKLFSDEILSFQVSGDKPAYIDIPTLHTHSITNIGDGQLQTLFWANEIFDPARPDTYPEAVVQ